MAFRGPSVVGDDPSSSLRLTSPLSPESFPADSLVPRIETCNVSGWGCGQLWLEQIDADIVLMQEHKQLPHLVASGSSLAIRHG